MEGILKPHSIGSLKAALRRHSEELPVMFSDGTEPDGVSSYRGFYAEAAVTRRDYQGRVIVCNFLADLDYLTSGTFEGYGGGSYTYNDETCLWVSQWGVADPLRIFGKPIFQESEQRLVLQLVEVGW